MFKFIRKTILYIIVFQFAYIIALKWINPPFTITQLTSLIEGKSLKRDYVDAAEMSRTIKLAVIAAEDQQFAQHSGFDLKGIQKAMEHNEKGKSLRGGSTISQQVAKNVFLWQGRTWVRKGLEAYFTFMIELIWGKERILEMYLNVSEMGIGVYGIEAASHYYFQKPAKDLTKDEAAKIAVVLPNPKKYNVNPADRLVTRRAAWVKRQMNNLSGDPAIEKIIQ